MLTATTDADVRVSKSLLDIYYHEGFSIGDGSKKITCAISRRREFEKLITTVKESVAEKMRI